MKYLLIVIALFLICSCARLTYQAPDGTKVTYARFLTGSDVIKGKVGEASIEAQGQQVIDAESLQIIMSILGRIK